MYLHIQLVSVHVHTHTHGSWMNHCTNISSHIMTMMRAWLWRTAITCRTLYHDWHMNHRYQSGRPQTHIILAPLIPNFLEQMGLPDRPTVFP